MLAKDTQYIIDWINRWFKNNGCGKNAIVGMSGGKDSYVTAMLCTLALGKDRVIGVTMPMGDRGEQPLLAFRQCQALGIKCINIDIGPAVDAILGQIGDPSDQTKFNLPARIRMSTLYAVSQSNDGRVACTSNLSEDYIGWVTRWGDGAGDFQPLGNLTATEVLYMQHDLNLKIFNVGVTEWDPGVPTDGLCGKTDEEQFRFTYHQLDYYIREGPELASLEAKDLIARRHRDNEFKLHMPDKPL